MDQVKIGKFIAKLRKDKNMTQEQLGEKLGVSFKTISKWETGRGLPELATLKPLSDILGITINELLSGEKIEKEKYIDKVEENMVNTIDYSRKKIIKSYKIIYLLLIIFGLFITISAITIAPAESSWGSIYSAVGITIFIIGISLNFKYLGNLKQTIIIFCTTILVLFILLFSNYISVKYNNQVPRFRINILTGDEISVYETLFYNAYKYKDNIYIRKHIPINKLDWNNVLENIK